MRVLIVSLYRTRITVPLARNRSPRALCLSAPTMPRRQRERQTLVTPSRCGRWIGASTRIGATSARRRWVKLNQLGYVVLRFTLIRPRFCRFPIRATDWLEWLHGEQDKAERNIPAALSLLIEHGSTWRFTHRGIKGLPQSKTSRFQR